MSQLNSWYLTYQLTTYFRIHIYSYVAAHSPEGATMVFCFIYHYQEMSISHWDQIWDQNTVTAITDDLSILCHELFNCPVLSCPVLSCPALSCPVVSCRVVSCRVVSCRVVSCRVVSCRVVSWSDLTWPDLTWPDLTWPDLMPSHLIHFHCPCQCHCWHVASLLQETTRTFLSDKVIFHTVPRHRLMLSFTYS